MKTTRPFSCRLLVASALLLLACRSHGGGTAAPTAVTASARPAHWGYEGDLGPSSWSTLSPAYAACAASKLQSPVDLPETGGQGTAAWTLNYKGTALKIAHHEHVTDILDNGHTIQVTVEEGSTLVTERGTYHLKQFHFHTPSEHTLGGKSFPMEAHFVHQNDAGGFAVVSVLFAEGAANANLAKLIANFPRAKGDSRSVPEVKLDLAMHLPATNVALYYTGSFTTPPCTDDVEWLVFRTPIAASAEQLETFAARLNHNNRPIQPTNERPIVAGAVADGFTKP
jgi:carbonic anhydrase